MILSTLIYVLLSVLLPAEELRDTLNSAVVETSVKQMLPLERLASPVSVVCMNELESMGVASPKHLSALVPNLHIPDYGSTMTSSIYLRGFGSRMENPVLGLYIDDVPVLNKNAYDMDMLDIRRADLFRGPQGTLYGRNSMCGVLSLNTLSPSVYKGVRAGVEYGSANTVTARASAYGKTEGGLAVGGGIGFRHSDGFYTNAFSGEKCDPYDGLSLRLRLEKQIRPDLYFENILSAGALTQGGWPYRQYIPETGELLETAYNDRSAYRRLNLTEAVKFRLEPENYTLNSISALQMLLDRMDMDQDFTTRSMFTLAQIQREGALTQEFVLKPKAGWRKERWDWQSGAFAFYKFNRMSAPVHFKQDGIADLILGNANANIPEEVSGGHDAPLAILEDNFLIGSEFGINTYGAALYHESYFTLGRWLLTAGLRLDYEGNAMSYCSDAAVNYSFIPTMKDWKLFETVYKGRVSNHYVEVLPKISALYDISGRDSQAAIFAVVSKGYRSGGFNTQIFSDILQNMMMNGLMADLGVYLDDPGAAVTAESTAYRPEKTWNYELGGRFSIRKGEHRISATASAFFISCRDQQITLFPPGKSTGRMMANVGRSRSIGAEASISYEVGGLSASASYGCTDARFTIYDDGNNDYSGNRIPYSPEHTLHARIGYSFSFGSDAVRGLSVNADCSGVGRIWWDEANTLSEPFVARLGADIRVDFKWFDLRFRMDNILNEDYNVFYFKSVGNSFFQRGKPVRWTAGISIDL
ncbi:MAG: TonB-dependent receptor [Bacteroidales bacterium]|nr:TonB-dependent receptor [Bacteroidales bacterium]